MGFEACHITKSNMHLTESSIGVSEDQVVHLHWPGDSPALCTKQQPVPVMCCAGVGGSYMCIYPMDSPGGYQLVGRTIPIWNTFGRTGPFTASKPWLLEFFDQVRRPLKHALWHRHLPILLLRFTTTSHCCCLQTSNSNGKPRMRHYEW